MQLLIILMLFIPVSALPAVGSPRATIEIPEAFNLKYVDGECYKRPLFSSGDVVLELAPGSYQLIIEYEEIWELNADDHERIVSEPLSVTFVAEGGRPYLLRYPDLDSVKAATVFAKAPVVAIVDVQTNGRSPRVRLTS